MLSVFKKEQTYIFKKEWTTMVNKQLSSITEKKFKITTNYYLLCNSAKKSYNLNYKSRKMQEKVCENEIHKLVQDSIKF